MQQGMAQGLRSSLLYSCVLEMVRPMLRRSLWLVIIVTTSLIPASATPSAAIPFTSLALEDRGRQVSGTFRRASQYVEVRHISSRPACANVEPPEALTTPDPLVTSVP